MGTVEAIKLLKGYQLMLLDPNGRKLSDLYTAIKMGLDALQSTRWIPFTFREPTEEERECWPEYDFVFTCRLPEDGEVVLLSNGKYVWEDTFHNDDGCYFENADDIEDWDDYAWMPMPGPYMKEAE